MALQDKGNTAYLMKKLLIWGNSEFAEHIFYQFKQNSNYDIAAFVVDAEYNTKSTLLNLPVENFENIEEKYPPAEYNMFIALGYSKMNTLRELKYKQAKEKGYELVSFIHPSSIVAENVKIGENCFIFENNVIQPFCKLSNNIFVYASSTICHHSIIENNVFIASNVCINGYVNIKKNSFIGASATIRNNITIEEKGLIGSGCTILENTKPEQVYKSINSQLLDITSDKVNL